MKVNISYLLSLFCLCGLGCTASKVAMDKPTVLPASVVPVYGRYLLDKDQKVELITSAAHFGFKFRGRECQIFATIPHKNEHNYLQYELDGVYQKRIRIDGNSQEPIVIKVPSGGNHKIWIYKATEAHTGPIYIEKITGERLSLLKSRYKPLIEFIGNSISCGAAADDSEFPCDTGEYHDHHNAYQAYGPRVARALKANFINSSVSGIGIYRNWNSDGPTMPQVYGNADFQDSGARLWDFKKDQVNIVSIALGTNDFSGGDGIRPRLPFDQDIFIQQYMVFIQQVKAKHPSAQIALLSSPMLNGERKALLEKCITTIKTNIDALYPMDLPIAVHFFKPMQARGCSGHPNVEDHAILAEELIPFFRKLLNEVGA